MTLMPRTRNANLFHRSTAMLFALSLPENAHAQSFVCKALSYVQLSETGQLIETGYTKAVLKARPEFLFNVEDATLLWSGSSLKIPFKIVQHGSRENSLV